MYDLKAGFTDVNLGFDPEALTFRMKIFVHLRPVRYRAHINQCPEKVHILYDAASSVQTDELYSRHPSELQYIYLLY